MTYEDQYYPAVDDDRSDDAKLKKNAIAESEKLDPNFQKVTKVFNNTWTDGKFYKKITIKSYGSGQMGSRIRNAVTGQYTPYLVGSKNEDLFFVVNDSTGLFGRKDPLFLFYDSPEQYENHQFIILKQPIKEKWYEKNLLARQALV
jgi:hypothetical protein